MLIFNGKCYFVILHTTEYINSLMEYRCILLPFTGNFLSFGAKFAQKKTLFGKTAFCRIWKWTIEAVTETDTVTAHSYILNLEHTRN